jgi:hypothetical protein
VAGEQFLGQAEFAPDLADFVLVEQVSGSTIRFSSISFWMPATRLWWVLMRSALAVPPLSMVSG